MCGAMYFALRIVQLYIQGRNAIRAENDHVMSFIASASIDATCMVKVITSHPSTSNTKIFPAHDTTNHECRHRKHWQIRSPYEQVTLPELRGSANNELGSKWCSIFKAEADWSPGSFMKMLIPNSRNFVCLCGYLNN